MSRKSSTDIFFKRPTDPLPSPERILDFITGDSVNSIIQTYIISSLEESGWITILTKAYTEAHHAENGRRRPTRLKYMELCAAAAYTADVKKTLLETAFTNGAWNDVSRGKVQNVTKQVTDLIVEFILQ